MKYSLTLDDCRSVGCDVEKQNKERQVQRKFSEKCRKKGKSKEGREYFRREWEEKCVRESTLQTKKHNVHADWQSRFKNTAAK